MSQELGGMSIEDYFTTLRLAQMYCLEVEDRSLIPVFSPPGAHKIVVGIALGYPDLDHPANAFRSEREPLEQFVRWIG